MKLFITTVAALSVTAATAATAKSNRRGDMTKLLHGCNGAVSSDLGLAQRRYRQQCQEDLARPHWHYGCGG